MIRPQPDEVGPRFRPEAVTVDVPQLLRRLGTENLAVTALAAVPVLAGCAHRIREVQRAPAAFEDAVIAHAANFALADAAADGAGHHAAVAAGSGRAKRAAAIARPTKSQKKSV